MTNPTARTAGEQSHQDPWALAGEDADAPEDCGRPDPFANMPTEVKEEFVGMFAEMPTELPEEDPPPHLAEAHPSDYPAPPLRVGDSIRRHHDRMMLDGREGDH